MMLWLLRLLPRFRAYESCWVEKIDTLSARVQSLTSDLAAARESVAVEAEERERVEQRLDVLTRDRDKLWALVEQAQAGERYALQSQANILSQRSGAGVPYPDAHKIDSPTLTQEGGPVGATPRMLPSQRAEYARQAAIQNLTKEIASQFVRPT